MNKYTLLFGLVILENFVRRLRIHDLVLVVNALHVYSIKIFGDELFAEVEFFTFLECSFQDLIPTVGLRSWKEHSRKVKNSTSAKSSSPNILMLYTWRALTTRTRS